MTTNPCTTARDLANALDSDPIAASQVKEYMSNERLIELLGIELPEPPAPEEPNIADFTDRELMAEIRNRKLVDEILENVSTDALMTEVKARTNR